MLQYGNWTVLGKAEGRQMLLCRCVCGTEKAVYKHNLITGKTRSCGCSMTGPVKHGMRSDPAYSPWKAMRARCGNPKHKNYPEYGARGITVCARWNDFAAFLTDMGPRPSSKHSIERNNSNGNYEPNNCRWATQKEQTRNTRRSKTITIDGVTKTVAEWCEIHNIPHARVYARLRVGKSGRNALFAAPYTLT